MSNLRQAAQQALEFCEFLWRDVPLNDYSEDMRQDVEAALRAALAEPEQDPVAWMRPDNRVAEESVTGKQFSRGPKEPPIGTWVPLYTAPTPRKPLTDEEIDELAHSMVRGGMSVNWLCRAIERAHGIGEQHDQR